MIAALLIVATINPWTLAPKDFADCDALVAQHPREYEAYFCYMRLSFRDPHAEWSLKTQGHLRERLKKQPDDQLARLMLALAGGTNEENEVLYKQAAAGLHAQGLFAGEVSARTALAFSLCADGRFREGEDELARSLEAAQQSGDPDMLSQTEGYTAGCALHEQDYGRALSLYRKSRARLLGGPTTWRTKWLLGNALDGLGQLYSKTGRHQEALEIFLEQLEALKSNAFTHACAEHRVAEEAVRLARQGGMSWEEADGYLRRALDDEVRLGCKVYINGGELYTRMLSAQRLGPTGAGVAEAQKAVQLASQWANRIHLCAPLRLLATLTIEHDAKALAPALAAAEQAIDLAQRYGSRLELAEGLLTRAQVRMLSGDRPQGLFDALAALGEFDRLRELQPDEMVRARSATEWSSAYHQVSALLLEQDAPERAFETMERLRARSLLELLAAPGGAAVDEPVRRKRSELLVSLSALQRSLLQDSLDDAGREAALAQIQQLESQEEELRDQLARAAPPRPLARNVTLAEVRAQLREGEAMLVFELLDRDIDPPADLTGAAGKTGDASGSSWLLAISRERLQAVRVPDAAALGGEVDLLAGLIARRDGSDESGAKVLYQQLLGEGLRALGPGISRLVIVPDGPLHRLPFEALRDGAGRALAESFEISIAPSASLWMRWRRDVPGAVEIPALALGDPALGEARGFTAISSAAWDLGERPAPLPGARAEANAVARVLGHGSLVRVGEEASEQFIKGADLSRFGILHFAAHTLVDELRPERSAILLAPGAASEDGLLQTREIASLRLQGCTVVLSACNGSSGALLQGEGVMSLARGFFQAGAGAVIGALWPLRDDDAALFFDAFYRRLGEGARLSEAMASARRARIQAGAPAAAWAGLVVIGDGSAVPIPAPLRTASPLHSRALVTLGGICAFGFVLWLRRRARR